MADEVKYRAKVSSFDSRRGVVLLAFEFGHCAEVRFETLTNLPVLMAGTPVTVTCDRDGRIRSVRKA